MKDRERGDDMRRQDRLPTDPVDRAHALVERSRPKADRPRLSDPELEARMVEAEQDRAVRFAAREDVFDRLDRVRETIDESEDGVISVEVNDEDSLVHHIAELRD
jgi:hypothetical protein